MPPPGPSLWHCTRSTWPRPVHHARLPFRAASSASPSRKIPTLTPKTTTAAPTAFSSNLPPESPKHIFVPQPPQPDKFVPRRMKGILPVPRHPFQRKKTRDSGLELAAATLEPAASRKIPAHLTPEARGRIVAKNGLAAQRRAHLREGTLELRKRYVVEKKIRDTRLAKRKAAQIVRKNAPEREDERLTAATVRKTTTPMSAALQEDPHAAERLAIRRAKYDALMSTQRERRADALHALYTRASDFVVDESSLNEAVEAAFTTPFYTRNPNHSVWDAEGMPETLPWLVAQQATSRRAYEAAMGRGNLQGLEPDGRLLKRGRERAERMVELLTRQVGEPAEAEEQAPEVKKERSSLL